jgi:hypothetical protein
LGLYISFPKINQVNNIFPLSVLIRDMPVFAMEFSHFIFAYDHLSCLKKLVTNKTPKSLFRSSLKKRRIKKVKWLFEDKLQINFVLIKEEVRET